MKSNLSSSNSNSACATLSLVFQLDRMRFGIPFSRVAEVRTLQTSMPVLHAPDYRAGWVVLHRRMLPLIDLRGHFGKPSSFDHDTRLIVAFVRRPGVDDALLGLLVDRIDDVVEVARTTEAGRQTDSLHSRGHVSVETTKGGEQLLLVDVDLLVATTEPE